MSNSIKASNLQLYLAVGIGGMIGSILRYSVSLLIFSEIGTAFHWATFFVNLIGSFLLAFVLFQPALKSKMKPAVFAGLTTGILGSFTTFSMIMIEIVSLWHNAQMIAMIYSLATLIGGIISSLLGYQLARKVNPS